MDIITIILLIQGIGAGVVVIIFFFWEYYEYYLKHYWIDRKLDIIFKKVLDKNKKNRKRDENDL